MKNQTKLLDETDVRHLALPHILPYWTIFKEYRARRQSELFEFIEEIREQDRKGNRSPGFADGELGAALDQAILECEDAYKSLAVKKEKGVYRSGGEQTCSEKDKPLIQLLHKMSGKALCLSGGGIRSASFCLGVLQGLASFGEAKLSAGRVKLSSEKGALSELDYLSTVSGGGYIGAWLMAWTYRECLTDKCGPEEAYHAVVRELAGDQTRVTSGDPSPRTLRHLREYTSFLAPMLGLTLDTWTLAAIVLRNLIVNWAMILPIFLFAVAFPQALRYGMIAIAEEVVAHGLIVTLALAGILFWVAGIVAGFRMPSRLLAKSIGDGWEPWFVTGVFVLPLAISALLLGALWYETRHAWAIVSWLLVPMFFVIAFLTFSSIGAVRVFYPNNRNDQDRAEHSPVRYGWAIFGASVATSLILSFALNTMAVRGDGWLKHNEIPKEVTTQATLLKSTDETVVLTLTESKPPISSPQPVSSGPGNGPEQGQVSSNPSADNASLRDRWYNAWVWLRTNPEVKHKSDRETADRFLIWVFACIWILLIAASALHSGFLGIFEEDIDREWWGRAGGLMLAVLLLWVVGETVAVYGASFDAHIRGLTLSGALTGLLAAIGGASTAGGLKSFPDNKANVSAIGGFLNRFGLILPTLSAVALLILTLLMARFEMVLAKAYSVESPFTVHFCILIGSLLVAVIVNWVVNINIFSLHGMYRMRLMRAFLGASNVQRKPNTFTGFDERDSVYEASVPCGQGVPLHIINATVNLVGTQNLAWRQRKAEGFTISPLVSGSWRLGYVFTDHYGRKGGLSLATAMAISGAAVNPNMGYHSSPLVTLLMTLFNVRLGWWLPNPKYNSGSFEDFNSSASTKPEAEDGPISWSLAWKRWRRRRVVQFLQKKAPRFALRPLLTEAFGMTDDGAAYIELTDGGHFENLGLYEMVMRRCHHIIVVDAGADPKCQFEDLGNALRKIEIDLGIPITFDDDVKMKQGPSLENRYCAVARIGYKSADGDSAECDGQLIYIKAVIRGDEPPDILQYSKTHDSFPHESTANQFFNEAQFESYRHLGSHAIASIAQQAYVRLPLLAAGYGGSVANFFSLVEIYSR